MPMKNPPHPARLLKDDFEELGWTIAQAAQVLGVSRQQLYNLVKGKSAITAEMALKLEKAVGSTAEMWLRLQVSYDLAQARLRQASTQSRRLGRKVA